MNTNQNKFFLNDWLTLHGLSKKELSLILSAMDTALVQERKYDTPKLVIDINDALAIVQNALSKIFLEIDEIRDIIERVELFPLQNNMKFPCTVEVENQYFPVVYCNFECDARSLMNLTHEYAHAVQLVLSQDKFMPPMYREVCAFFGENALIDYCRTHFPTLATQLVEIQHVDNEMYLLRDKKYLEHALTKPEESFYHYRWNYPLARLIAEEIHQSGQVVDFTNIFKNKFDPAIFRNIIIPSYARKLVMFD